MNSRLAFGGVRHTPPVRRRPGKIGRKQKRPAGSSGRAEDHQSNRLPAWLAPAVAATTAAAATEAAATASSATATAAAELRFRPGFVDCEGPPAELGFVQLGHGFLRVGVGCPGRR